jgi:hypothetical protein
MDHSAFTDEYWECSISRQLSRYYHDTCEKCSFVALLVMDGVSHFYVLEWSACLSDPAKSLVVVKVSRPRPSRLTDSSLSQADMNLDVIRTLVVDENLVLCRVLLTREGEVETNEG